MDKQATQSLSSYNSTPQTNDLTRDCTDPWTFLQILGNGNIRPCCFHEVTIGSVSKDKGGIEAALNSEAVVTLRKQLLTGELDEYCKICTYRPMINKNLFQLKIRTMLSPLAPVMKKLALRARLASLKKKVLR